MRKRLATPTLMIFGVWTVPVMAQTAENEAGAQNAQIDTIVVTARRREESLQDTPIAVTALSEAELDRRDVQELTDVYRYVPNVQFSTAAAGTSGASSVFIRGIGQLDFITTTEPGVGVYLDGVYLARVTGAALDLADVSRVEVLRGPQGTLFGRNTIGGAVNVVTRKPDDIFEGAITARVGSQGRYELTARAGGPLSPDISAGLSILARTDDGYGTNRIEQPGIDQELGAGEEYAARLQIAATVSDATEIDVALDYLDREGTTTPHTLVAFTPSPASDAFNATDPEVPLGPDLVNAQPDLDRIRNNTPMIDNLEVFGAALTLTHNFGGAVFKSVSSYRRQEGQSGQDFDGTPAAFLDQFIDSRQFQLSQELQLSGEAFGDRLDWIVGGYAFVEDGRFDSFVTLSGTPIEIETNSRTESFAAYGQASLEIVDDLRLTAGARYTEEEKSLDGITTRFGPFVLVPPTDLADDFSNFSPKVGIDWEPSENLLVYGSIARGFRSGGFNGRPFSPPDLTSFDAEKVTSYELGFKADLWNRRLRLNAAAFYNDYTDIQLTAVTNSGGTSVVRTGNAATAELYGIEVEFEAKPTPALSLFGSIGWLDNSLEEKEGFTFGATELPTAPEWTAALGGRYDAQLTDTLLLSFAADYSYTSSFAPQFDPSPAARIPAYSLVNANVTLRQEDAGWHLRFFAENLFDETYRTYAQTAGSQDVTVAWFGPTRRLGVEFGYEF